MLPQANKWRAERVRKEKLSEATTSELFEYIAQLEAELENTNQWIADLQSGLYINCVYCGHRYPPGSGSVMQDILYEHIKTCPKHPLSKAIVELQQLREELDAWIEKGAMFVEQGEELQRLQDEVARLRSGFTYTSSTGKELLVKIWADDKPWVFYKHPDGH